MTPTLDLSLNDHNGVVVRRDPLTRDHRLNVRSGSEADATEASVRVVPILLKNSLGEHFGHRGKNHFATPLIANPDSKNHRGENYSTGDVHSARPPTKSTQSATSRRQPARRRSSIPAS